MADDAPDLCPECGHPWKAHEGGGCTEWPRGLGPCTCRRTPPKDDDGDKR